TGSDLGYVSTDDRCHTAPFLPVQAACCTGDSVRWYCLPYLLADPWPRRWAGGRCLQQRPARSAPGARPGHLQRAAHAGVGALSPDDPGRGELCLRLRPLPAAYPHRDLPLLPEAASLRAG